MTKSSLSRAALAALLLAGCHGPSGAPEVTPAQGASAAPIRVATALTQARQVPDVLQATGSLVPDQMAQVTPIVGGRVMQTYVERGARVREGDPLIRLRDTDYRTNAAAAQASVAQARARLGLESGAFRPENMPEVRAAGANADAAADALRRAQTLVGRGSMSDAEYQRVVAQATAAEAQHRAALNGARAAYVTNTSRPASWPRRPRATSPTPSCARPSRARSPSAWPRWASTSRRSAPWSPWCASTRCASRCRSRRSASPRCASTRPWRCASTPSPTGCSPPPCGTSPPRCAPTRAPSWPRR